MRIGMRLMWWTMFLLATFTLSKVFEASRIVTGGGAEAMDYLMLVFWLLMLVFSLLVLGYDAYMKAKSEQKLVHQVWLYEKFNQCMIREDKP